MNGEGVGKLFANNLADGPFPEHYEPMESPAVNTFNSQKVNPATVIIDAVRGEFGDAGRYPYIGTSYRVVEHWQAGAMTRNLPWLAELVPDMFCEISPTLAKAKGIQTAIGEILMPRVCPYALVTGVQPWKINGKTRDGRYDMALPWVLSRICKPMTPCWRREYNDTEGFQISGRRHKP